MCAHTPHSVQSQGQNSCQRCSAVVSEVFCCSFREGGSPRGTVHQQWGWTVQQPAWGWPGWVSALRGGALPAPVHQHCGLLQVLVFPRVHPAGGRHQLLSRWEKGHKGQYLYTCSHQPSFSLVFLQLLWVSFQWVLVHRHVLQKP